MFPVSGARETRSLALAPVGVRFAEVRATSALAAPIIDLFSEKGAAENEDCGHANRGGQLVCKGSPGASFRKIIVDAGMVECIRHRHHLKAQRHLDALFFIFGTEITHRTNLFAAFTGHFAIFLS